MRPEVPTTERLRAMYMENGFVVVPPYRYSPVQQGDEFVVERTNMLEQTTVIIGQGPFQTMAQAASWLQSQGSGNSTV